ncbi:Auxin-responsive protein SAUR50 [Glycine soja]
MLGKKSFKKLAKKVKKGVGGIDPDPVRHECLLKEYEEECATNTPPIGFFAVYVGEERQRYVVPTRYLSHPLFKMLLEKAYDEFGFSQRNGLVIPCSVSTFQEVVNAIECNNDKFDLGKFFAEFDSLPMVDKIYAFALLVNKVFMHFNEISNDRIDRPFST